VFGASGSANFLSSTTKWLAVVFFAMSLGMAWYASKHGGRLMPSDTDDVGLMAEAAPAADAAAPAPVSADAPAVEVPVAPAPEAAVPAAADVAAPAAETATPTAENPPEGESGG
jgi:preprotein translocase subunit SecG